MGQRDPRVDDYIANAPSFAQPILTELRAAVHAACPTVTETIKWHMPFFEYQGPLCFMAAFKAHCGFGFWKHAVLAVDTPNTEAMGQLGRLTTVEDLPPKKKLKAWLQKAVEIKDGR